MSESGATGARPSPSEELAETGRPVSHTRDRTLGHISGGQKLSWNEVRVRAARFAQEWQDARYEKGELL